MHWQIWKEGLTLVGCFPCLIKFYILGKGAFSEWLFVAKYFETEEERGNLIQKGTVLTSWFLGFIRQSWRKYSRLIIQLPAPDGEPSTCFWRLPHILNRISSVIDRGSNTVDVCDHCTSDLFGTHSKHIRMMKPFEISDHGIKMYHEKAAKKAVTPPQDKVDNHFITFVYKGGVIYEIGKEVSLPFADRSLQIPADSCRRLSARLRRRTSSWTVEPLFKSSSPRSTVEPTRFWLFSLLPESTTHSDVVRLLL